MGNKGGGEGIRLGRVKTGVVRWGNTPPRRVIELFCRSDGGLSSMAWSDVCPLAVV